MRLLIFTLVCLLAGCGEIPSKPAAVSQEFMPIAPPMGPARRIVQQLTAIWPGRQEALLVVLELDAKHIAMAGVSNAGMSLFGLNYDGVKLDANKNPLLPESVNPKFIIADLQLAYWPVSALQKVLPSGWRLELKPKKRVLYKQQQKFAQADYQPSTSEWPMLVELTNFAYNYQLHIKTVSYELVPE